ncbi:hypothetical protein NDI56_12430 [Haloarcula sp. S1CR25-12]|uniref:DUF4897 domain-containing protein n=1 Tax=Haloarcula saliterrae TaxID=2950534 RepID=A0ABU2FD60_9EURY|nr:hypothetical protein [Haloarcula sp. S1CR25-12]MDS0260202.1 hypothetical protein [Haloarcula sp. S1CR25-12]
MRRPNAVLTVAILLATVAPAAATAGGLAQQSVDADVVVLTADIAQSGDAAWTVDYRVRLTDENETRAFEGLRTDIRGNESTYTDAFHERMNRTARAGENATGRPMAIQNVTVATTQESFGQSYGVVTYRFRWTNFAVGNDTYIEAGDALSGLYLDRNTSLTLQWPGGYRSQTVTPSPDEATDSSVTWRGRQSFGADEPRVVASAGRPLGDDVVERSPLPGVLGLILVSVAVTAAGYGAYRYVLADDDAGDGGGDSAAASPDDTPADGAGASDDTPPADLLSNEEQVLKLLRAEGGRVKQQALASELDWTAAKTSQVIGGLRDDGELETFRIGRENVVTLPETDLSDADDE